MKRKKICWAKTGEPGSGADLVGGVGDMRDRRRGRKKKGRARRRRFLLWSRRLGGKE